MRLILTLLLVLNGCSTPRLRCDKLLVPINQPEPKQSPLPAAGKLP